MPFIIALVLCCSGLFIGMLVAHELGRIAGRRHLKLGHDADNARWSNAEGAVFALLGLLIGFTFAGAASRFDERRRLISDEANAIGTAWLRIDLLHADDQAHLRPLFRAYLDTRLAVTRTVDFSTSNPAIAEEARLQQEIWTTAVAGCNANRAINSTLVLSSLNDVFDIASTRKLATSSHPPLAIFLLLAVMAVASSFIAGHHTAPTPTRNWLRNSLFSVAVTLTVFVIIEVEFPRRGLIRVDSTDSLLEDLRRSMG